MYDCYVFCIYILLFSGMMTCNITTYNNSGTDMSRDKGSDKEGGLFLYGHSVNEDDPHSTTPP